MYLLCACKKQLKELGFTDAYPDGYPWYVVVITPAQYALYLLKFEESSTQRNLNDEKKSLIIYSNWRIAYQTSRWYNDTVFNIENNTIHLKSL